MSKLAMDLKKFKKVASDEHSSTLAHSDGHQMRIMHKALSPEMKKQLHALPLYSGGEVNPKLEQSKKQLNNNSQEASIQHYADGTPDGGAQDAPQAPVVINVGQPGTQNAPQIPDSMVNPNPGSQAVAQNPPIQQAQPQIPDQYGVDKEEVAKMQEAQAASQAPAMAVSQQAASQASPDSLNPQSQQNPDPYGTEAQLNALQQGIGEKKAGIVGESMALGQEGGEQASALGQNVQKQQQNIKNYRDHYGELDNERQSFQQDLNNQHIDPKHYLNSLGTGGKISTAIGLILGGIGGGLTHQENPALKFLNQQIERDIDSQKAELGKKENLLSANMRQFGNIRDASDMTRVMQNDIVSNQLKQAAAKAQTPLAASNALKAAGDLDMQTAPILSQIALRKTLMGSIGDANQDPGHMGQVIQAMRQLNPEMAKSMEERFVPGVGMAQIPIPKEARDNIIAKQQLSSMANDFANWAQKHSGSIDPRIMNEGKTKAAELQSLYRNSINGGVFKKGEQEFIDNIIDSDPTKFFNSIRVLPKLKEVIKNNNQQLETLKKGYGLPSAPKIDFQKK